MTEEIKCNFQQNYNVYGLDDKHCCYLYHKYCNEIEDCEHKQLRRLKQENEKLKEEIEACYNQVEDFDIFATSQCNKNAQYRKALEEIREIAYTTDFDICDIQKICNEVLG